MTLTRITIGFLATAALAAPLSTAAQEQTSKTRPGWPCGGRLAPGYLDIAEATGGYVYMLAPDEAEAAL